MIRFFLLQNRAGKTRLAKYYSPFNDDDKSRMEDEVHRMIATRDLKFTSFIEARKTTLKPPLEPIIYSQTSHRLKIFPHMPCPFLLQYKTFKLVYRRYAGLYFVFCVDVTDNELLYLETIHLFVEVSIIGGASDNDRTPNLTQLNSISPTAMPLISFRFLFINSTCFHADFGSLFWQCV